MAERDAVISGFCALAKRDAAISGFCALAKRNAAVASYRAVAGRKGNAPFPTSEHGIALCPQQPIGSGSYLGIHVAHPGEAVRVNVPRHRGLTREYGGEAHYVDRQGSRIFGPLHGVGPRERLPSLDKVYAPRSVRPLRLRRLGGIVCGPVACPCRRIGVHGHVARHRQHGLPDGRPYDVRDPHGCARHAHEVGRGMYGHGGLRLGRQVAQPPEVFVERLPRYGVALVVRGPRRRHVVQYMVRPREVVPVHGGEV